MNKSKIFIVDDNPLVRESLTKLINHEPDLTVCGEAETGNVALEKIKQLNPDVAIVDLGLQDMHGIELIRRLKSANPLIRVLVMSMYDESLYGEKAFQVGAQGYLMKHYSVDHVVKAIRWMLDGKKYMSDQLAAQLGRN